MDKNVLQLEVSEFRHLRRILNKAQLVELIAEIAKEEAKSGQRRKKDNQGS